MGENKLISILRWTHVIFFQSDYDSSGWLLFALDDAVLSFNALRAARQ